MTDEAKLNYVALKIIEVLSERFPDDTGYINGKTARLLEFGDNNPATFFWATHQLDADNLAALCDKLGIINAPSVIHGFTHVMQKL